MAADTYRISLSILEKDTDGSAEGSAYWHLVYDFLKGKGFEVEWDEHMYIYGVPWSWGYLEGKKESDRKKLGIKIQELLTSDEFNVYKRQWLADLSIKVLAVDFDKMKAIHGEFPAMRQSKKSATS